MGVDVVRLNLGCGDAMLDGYVNLDRKTGQEAYPLVNVADGSVDEIRASHLLEHFSYHDAADVIRHWVSKLRPGGLLKIAVPDFDRVARDQLNGRQTDAMGYLLGGQVDEDDYHKSLYNEKTLRGLLMHVGGLERIERWSADAADCSALDCSLNLLGYKPTSLARLDGVRGVLATARFGPALHHRCVYDVLPDLGIDYHVVQSCFWHQGMSEGIERAIGFADCRYVLTGDFDSIFAADDVLELYRILEEDPSIDAVAPLQCKRGADRTPLLTMETKRGQRRLTLSTEELLQRTIPVATAHFGLTLFRADSLRKFPRPWMCPKPNADGRWAEGRTDVDIDFWQHWHECGNTLHVATRVRIGHLDEVILWPDAQWQPVIQTLVQYQVDGRPAL